MDLRGEAEHALAARDPESALAAADAGLAATPEDADLWTLKGRALNNLRRLPEAEAAFWRAVELDPAPAAHHHNLGHVLWVQGRLAEARRALEACLEREPEHPAALHKLGLIANEENRIEDAVTLLRRAAATSEDERTDIHLAAVLHKLDQDDEARTLLEAVRERLPGDPEVLTNLAVVLQAQDALAEAETVLTEALASAQQDPRIWEDMAYLQMRRGEPVAAMAATQRCLSLRPSHAGALSIHVPALYAAGQVDEGGALQPWEMIRAYDLEDLGQDPAVLNPRLAAHVLAHPSLSYEPRGHATRKGGHTADLLQGDPGPVGRLVQGIREAVQRYMDSLSERPEFPLSRSCPERWTLTAWSVVMDAQGHQLPHVHPSAWVSGVYYVQIPPVISADDPEQAGWIEFGEPPADFVMPGGHPVKRFQPVEGRLFLFPSWYWHRTVPFESATQRICIAFDVLEA